MASRESVRKMAGIVWIKFQTTRPKTPEEMALIQGMWEEILAGVPDAELMAATRRFVAETPKLFPGDDPFAMIFALTKPRAQETQGDFLELAIEAVGKFGWMREDEAMRWLEGRSPLVAATVRRFGYRQLCETPTEDLGTIRGQMRAVFGEERDRANRIGGVMPSAQALDQGSLPEKRGGLKCLGLPFMAKAPPKRG